MWFVAIVSFLLGVVVGGVIVFKNIDLVVQERYRKHRGRRRRDDENW